MTLATDGSTEPERLSHTARQLLALRERVMAEWERRVRDGPAPTSALEQPILINTLPSFFDNLAQAISPDYPRTLASTSSSIAAQHGDQRARLTDYKVELVILEYQLFHQVLLDVAADEQVVLRADELYIIGGSIDHAVREASSAFSLATAALREQFVATLTHDMRTPLNAASLAAEMILRSTDSAEIKSLASRIVETHRRIDEMIRGLLDVTAEHAGQRPQLTFSYFDIRDLAKEACAQLATTDEARTEIVGDSLFGWWDRDAMKRAMENLLSNAVKYGARDSAITIKVTENLGQLILSIHNLGDPIAIEDQTAIFLPFRRSSVAHGARVGGWGLGLAYVRMVAESHGGSVVVDSSAELGTTFLIDVPMDARPHRNAPTLA